MLVVIYALFIIFARQGVCDSARKDARGPIFRNEPPSRIEFSNSSGTEIRCNADGIPTPTISWQTKDGTISRDMPGLRHMRSDGTLVFPPFSKSDYRQEVHDTVYQCVASNNVGIILSREVHVRGVMKQHFTPQVFDDFVVKGNTAVLKCHLPSFVREYVVIDSWIRNDGHILKITENKARSYTVLRSGELLIHEIQEKDSNWSYRCQTRHRLTGEMVTSVSSGKIVVTESHASTLPRITFHQAQVRYEEGFPAQLPCVAQGNPPPTYRWMKEGSNGILKPVKEDARIWISQGTLNIKKVFHSDGSKYQCIARNSIGERRIESALIVSAPLLVHLRPPYQALNIGQEATFNCNVTGYPVHTVTWKKDQRQIPPSSRVRLLSRDVLHISSVRREDRGMYQCFVFNDQEGAQGTGELKISDVAPTFISVFSEHTVHPGDSISLKCISTGNPIPSVTWYLDDSILGQNPRIIAGDYASDIGHVTSFLNITDILVEDSGEYQCHVTNDVGSVYHSNRLNVYGPPFIRRMKNITAISGEDLVLRCPYGGHPVKGIRWLKGVAYLPLNHRQKISHGGSLTIQSVERKGDEGEYSCMARDDKGETATASTHVSVVVSPVIDPHFFRDSVVTDEGLRAKFMCLVVKGDPPLRFHWLKNGLPFIAHGDTTVQTFDDSSILTFKKVSSSDRGHYTCVASNMASSTNMTTQLVVNVPPQWTVEPQNISVVLGNTVWMDCAAVGFPAPNILWKKMIYTESTAGDFTYVHSGPRAHRYNNGTLVLSDVEENDSGSYLCQASNGIGSGLSKIIGLKVLVPPRFKDPYQSKTVTEGTNISIACSTVGDPPIVIKWMKNKSILEAKTNQRYTIEEISTNTLTQSELQVLNASREDTGIYTCSATSDIGADEAVIKLIVQGIPDPPSNVTVMNITSRSFTLHWEILDNGNSHITGSIVQYQTHTDKDWDGQTSQLIVSSAETVATLRGLTPVTIYYARIIAENALGKSKPSEVIEVTTKEEVPSGSPTEVHVHSTGAQSMKVMWKAPPEETRNGDIKGYYVGYKMSSGEDKYTFKKVEKSTSEQQSTYITGLQPFTEYDIIIKAYNSAGAGPESPPIMGKTLETAPPTSPIVQVLTTTSSSIEFRWEKDPKDKSAITEYMLHYKPDNGDWEKLRLNKKQDHYSLDGLKCGTRYHLYMTASNSLGTGEPSEQVTARTLGAAPMSAHESSFLLPNMTSVTLNLVAWQSGGCPIKHFVVQYRPNYLNTWTTLTDRLDMPRDTYVIRNLAPDRDYVILVTAHSDAGLTQAEYLVRTLPVAIIVPTSSPAFGKRETDLPFYKNVNLIIPVVVSSLVLIIVIFTVVVCLRKHSEDREERLDYENRKDGIMMKDLNKQMNMKPAEPSHYTCPAGKKGEYTEPYTYIDTVSPRQASDELFATIKRCPTRPIYVSGSYNKGISQSHEGSFQCPPEDGATEQKVPNKKNSDLADTNKWCKSSQSNIGHNPIR
ncbi:cell adhesion molecule Dscam2-like isoform X2 [Argiope bruennichi]|uniref:cell adhesion molecule Dscam2-like isoform X2 n=1 Tax=Argiope bruennichi TaxID=94029 RepID=UPI002493F0EF|nr:cell adhesion molecule Dscam2-like isoform X2 [Argiope bruennichi]